MFSLSVSDNDLAAIYENRYRFDNGYGYYVVNDLPFLYEEEQWRDVPFVEFESSMFGVIKPKDSYQKCFFHSLLNKELTFCCGPAGSGKSIAALAYAFQELEHGRISKIIVLTNPYVARGAVKLGFLPGTKNDKLLETSIGYMLSSKLGGNDALDFLINRGQLEIIPIGDTRGFEAPVNSFVYVTEAQNTSAYLMKLLLQRIPDGCKVCIEGDSRQADTAEFSINNGFDRAMEVFASEPYCGVVELHKVYRGKIAAKAEEMC